MQSNEKIEIMETKRNSGVDIVFEDIKYDVQVEVEKEGCNPPCCKEYQVKSILKGVSGVAKAGETTVIMGASGAGKTTLLNILACRIARKENTVGAASGKITANGQEYKYEDFGDFANYVMQDDILLQTLTVRETIQYVAQLKLDEPEDERKEKVNQLVKNLKLQKCVDTYVGGPILKGISGGQRKRTSIAFQLITNPSVILLDEPTSGLDSLTAYIICSHLNKLTKEQNKTVIMTIHQPSSQLFALFDQLILMAEGRMVYQGKSSQALPYFDNMGFKCPEFSNPPDYFMSILHHESSENVKNYDKYFSTYDNMILPQINNEIKEKKVDEIPRRNIEVPFCQGLGAIVRKDWYNTLRNPMVVKTRVIQSIILSLLVGGAYFNLDQNYDPVDQFYGNENFSTMIGLMFFLNMFSFMSALSPVTLVFPRERQVFLKEEGTKLYSTFTFYMSRNVIQLPFIVLIPMIMTLILYWMVGMGGDVGRFFTFYLILFLVSFVGNSLGLLLGSIANDAKVVSALVPVLILPFVLFSGLYKNRTDLPVWLGWIEYLSPLKYGFTAMTENQTTGVESPIEQLGFDVSMWNCIYILIGFLLGVRMLSLLFLWAGRQKLQ